jgi:hypothetical protein
MVHAMRHDGHQSWCAISATPAGLTTAWGLCDLLQNELVDLLHQEGC